MDYFETHAHPDHPLIADRNIYMQSMKDAHIRQMVVAPISYESNYTSMELFPEEDYPNVFFAKGLHPKEALNSALWTKKTMDEFCALLTDSRVVAMKSGLDFTKQKVQDHQINRQYEFLKLFMNIAEQYHKPLVLHIREAADEALQFFQENPLRVPAEIHCFVYDYETMQRFIEAGICYFGIGGMVTRSDHPALQEAVRRMPLDMILLESDAPFVRVEGEQDAINTSAKAIPIVAQKIADLKGITLEEVARVTYWNAKRFFKIEEDDI